MLAHRTRECGTLVFKVGLTIPSTRFGSCRCVSSEPGTNLSTRPLSMTYKHPPLSPFRATKSPSLRVSRDMRLRGDGDSNDE